MFKKALLISALAMTSFLFTSTSFAIQPSNVPCPSKKLIKESVDKVEYVVNKGDKWHQYAVGSKTPAFESDGHAWMYITVVHGTDAEDALKHAKKNLRTVLGKFNDFAETKKGQDLLCEYVGTKGFIMVGAVN